MKSTVVLFALVSLSAFAESSVIPPSNVSITSANATSIAVSWDGSAESYTASISTREIFPEEGTSVRRYTFDEFNNEGSNGEKTSEILGEYPDLEGYRLYLPTNSSGQIQLSIRKSRGELSLPGFQSCSGMAMAITACRYNNSNEATTMNVSYASGGTTNDFAAVDLGLELARTVVDISDVPANARIILNNATSQTYHRVIVDDIDFIENYVPAHTNVNTIASKTVRGNSTRFTGLDPNVLYWVEIESGDGEGNMSEPVVRLARTNGNDSGFQILLR